MTSLRFRARDEPWQGRYVGLEFARRWPVYRTWFRADGGAARPDLETCRRMIDRDMPELVPLYDRLLVSLGADEEQARFLSSWCPPNFMHGCTQAIWRRQPYGLIRNYDYITDLCDALLLRSVWFGNPVLAMSDCVWGVLDGMNAAGLAVSLSFGGRRIEGPGFGVTLILRYILETCRSAAESLAVLQRVPVHLSCNIALLIATTAGTRWPFHPIGHRKSGASRIRPIGRAGMPGQTNKACPTPSAARSFLRPALTIRSRQKPAWFGSSLAGRSTGRWLTVDEAHFTPPPTGRPRA